MAKRRSIISKLGPGIITGAADDDPSGIATYSIAGARLGTMLLWTSLYMWPLMLAVQMSCARIGMITGGGLASSLKLKFPKPILVIIAFSLFAANTINVGADLAGMADAAQLLTGFGPHLFVVLFATVITFATVWLKYNRIAVTLKWFTTVLFAYAITAFLVHPHWTDVIISTITPGVPHSKTGWTTLLAIFGTTISPYLFFWQASEEVEEEKEKGRITLEQRQGATPPEIHERFMDVAAGTFFSNLIMFFIILTTALTLNENGITDIQSSKEAALALKPLAGSLAMMLYTLGVLGVGFLAIPTLLGSASYAFAETFGWHQGLEKPFHKARSFYIIMSCAAIIAVLMNFTSIRPLQALLWSAVINGVLSPFLLVGIVLVARDNCLMQGQRSPLLESGTVLLTAALMFMAAIAMFILPA